MGYNFVADHGPIFFRVAVGSQIYKISRNSERIRGDNTSRSSKVINLGLGVNRKSIHVCDFLLVINSNFGLTSYLFRDIDVFSYKMACFPHPSIVDALARGTL